MADVAGVSNELSEDEWNELLDFIAKAVERHADIKFIETLAKTLNTHIYDKFRVIILH